jgi:hypothetical protein
VRPAGAAAELTSGAVWHTGSLLANGSLLLHRMVVMLSAPATPAKDAKIPTKHNDLIKAVSPVNDALVTR